MDCWLACFAPADDHDGPGKVVIINIPETPQHQIPAALRNTQSLHARLVFICDTKQQAKNAAKLARKSLSHYRQVTVEQANAGQWAQRH